MACDRFVEIIRASAHGSGLRTDAAAHLAVCSDCREALESEEQVLSTIDTALQQLTAVRPAPNFAARVRARVESAPQWTPRTWVVPGAAASLIVATLCVAIAVVAFDFASRRNPTVSHVAASPEALPKPAAPINPVAEVGSAPRVEQAGRRARGVTRSHTTQTAVPGPIQALTIPGTVHTPEVVTPQDQRQAVNRLFASLRSGRPEVIAMLRDSNQRTERTQSRPLTIEPIKIEPIVVPPLPQSESIINR